MDYSVVGDSDSTNVDATIKQEQVLSRCHSPGKRDLQGVSHCGPRRTRSATMYALPLQETSPSDLPYHWSAPRFLQHVRCAQVDSVAHRIVICVTQCSHEIRCPFNQIRNLVNT